MGGLTVLGIWFAAPIITPAIQGFYSAEGPSVIQINESSADRPDQAVTVGASKPVGILQEVISSTAEDEEVSTTPGRKNINNELARTEWLVAKFVPIGVLFTALTFVLIARSLDLQRRDLKETRNAHSETTRELARSRRASELHESRISAVRYLGEAEHHRPESLTNSTNSLMQRVHDPVLGLVDRPSRDCAKEMLTVRRALEVEETLAASTNTGVFDLEFVNIASGGRLLRLSRIASYYLRSIRRLHPRRYDQLDSLCTRLVSMQMSQFALTEEEIDPETCESKLFNLAIGHMGHQSAKDLQDSLVPFSFDRRRELLQHIESAGATSHTSMILTASRRERVRVATYRQSIPEVLGALHSAGEKQAVASQESIFDRHGASLADLYDSTLAIHSRSSGPRASSLSKLDPRDDWARLSLRSKEDGSPLNHVAEQARGSLVVAVHDQMNEDKVKAMLLATPFERLEDNLQSAWRRCLDGLNASECTIGPDTDHNRSFDAGEFVILRLFASPFSLDQKTRNPHYKGVGRLMLRKAIEAVQDLDPVLIGSSSSDSGRSDSGQEEEYRQRIAVVCIPEGSGFARMRSLVESEGGWRVRSEKSTAQAEPVHPNDQRSIYIF